MKQEPLRYPYRHRFLLAMMGVLFAGLVGRAVYLTVINSDFLRQQGDARMMRTEPVLAMRGVLHDRNGTPLAVSTPVVSLWINPRQALAEKINLDALARAAEVNPDDLRRRVLANARKGFLYVKRHLSPVDAKRVLAIGFPGVSGVTEYRRFYPEGEVTSHLLGFTDLDGRGKEGLELQYNTQLTGEAGIKHVVKDLKGRRVQDVALVKPARPGRDLTLSFDSRVQYAAYRELARGVADHGAAAGALVSLDVETGEVLAMANLPAYNPNNRQNMTPNTMRNRAVTDMFEPGSTMKLFTVAAALESGKYTARSRFNTNPGTYRVLNKLVRDHDNYGVIDLPTLLTKSSNVASAQIAMSLPRNTLPDLHRRMGLGAVTGSGFPGESAGRLQPASRWNPVEVVTMSYGYGVTVTALQLARAYAAVASGGVLRPVSFLKQDGPVPGKRVMDEKIALSLIPMLETVVSEEGTAIRAAVPGYRVAGKTGTAHKSRAGGYATDQYMSFFVGLAPASRPRVVTAVVIDTPSKGGYYGGLAAAPVFSRMMSDTLRLMNVEPDASAERLADHGRQALPVVVAQPGGDD